MTIPTENLDAMIQFLTDASETSGDHFMQAADMLRTQQTHIAELEALSRADDDEIELKRLCIAGMEDQADKMSSRIAELEEAVTMADDPIDPARFTQAPCYLCGYNGPDYYQPEVHRCAGDYHKASTATVAVDAWALKYLKSCIKALDALTAADHGLSFAICESAVISAARRLLTGGE